MAQLISPGVDVTIVDESFYIPGRAASFPLIFIATEDEKLQPDGVSPAVGTYEHNVLRTVTSLRQSLQLYGIPKYLRSASDANHHGDARNEYGLDALNKYLEIGNRAYVIRANVNLNDNIQDIKALWTRKIQIAADYLNELVSNWLQEYNSVNNLYPADQFYKTSVDGDTLKVLLNEALKDVFNMYNFSREAKDLPDENPVNDGRTSSFRDEFLLSNLTARPAYQDVLTETYNGFITLGDFAGLDEDEEYRASIYIVGDYNNDNNAESTTINLSFSGSDIITFGDLVDAINSQLNNYATCELIQGAIRITSTWEGPTSSVVISDGISGSLPLFASLSLFDRIAAPINGKGPSTLNIYDDSYDTIIGGDNQIVGGYVGLYGLIDQWNSGSVEPTEFTADEAEGLLLAAAGDFDNTKEFVFFTSLGSNNAERYNEIERAIVAAINNPNNGSRSEWLEYNIVLAPGFHGNKVASALYRLMQDQLEEVFILDETPFDKPATGPGSIAAWATSGQNRNENWHGAAYFPHGLSSNIDGRNIMTTAASAALRVFAYNDQQRDVWWPPAGVNRGQCGFLQDIGYVSGTLGGPTTFVQEYCDTGTRDELYESPKNINPLAYIPGRGILVMGQKTGQGTPSALDRINVSRLCKFIKRQLRKGLFSFLFEPNDSITWDLVKSACDGFLSTLVDRRGLYDFAVLVDETNNTPETIDNNELHVDIAIKPVKAVEFIYVKVRVVRTGANIGTGRTRFSLSNR
jgi:hypothetical protein